MVANKKDGMDILEDYISLTDPHDPESTFCEPIIEEIFVPMCPDAHIYYVKYERFDAQELFYINTKSKECKILNDDFYWCYNVEVRIIKSRVYLIACKATHMGNGEISVYRVTNDDIEELVCVERGVDHNWDSVSNADYERGYLRTWIDYTDIEHPDMEFEGIENVYGSFEEGTTTNKSYDNIDRILYQRWNIYKKYTWREEENKYVLTEDERTLIQQMEGVYPILVP